MCVISGEGGEEVFGDRASSGDLVCKTAGYRTEAGLGSGLTLWGS